MWPNTAETADLVTFTEETLNGKLHFLCSVFWSCFEVFVIDFEQFFCSAPEVHSEVSQTHKMKV